MCQVEQIGAPPHKYVGNRDTAQTVQYGAEGQRSHPGGQRPLPSSHRTTPQLYAQQENHRPAFSPGYHWQKRIRGQFSFLRRLRISWPLIAKSRRIPWRNPVPMEQLLCGVVWATERRRGNHQRPAFRRHWWTANRWLCGSPTVPGPAASPDFSQRMGPSSRVECSTGSGRPSNSRKSWKNGGGSQNRRAHRLPSNPDVEFAAWGFSSSTRTTVSGRWPRKEKSTAQCRDRVLTLSATPIPRTLHLAW